MQIALTAVIAVLTAAILFPADGRAERACRPYSSTVNIGGVVQRVEGTVCRQPDGTWRVVNRPGSTGDHDRARDAVAAGEALPLGEILSRVRRRYPGELLDAKLDRRGGRGPWFYELKLMSPENKVMMLNVDARSGQVLSVR